MTHDSVGGWVARFLSVMGVSGKVGIIWLSHQRNYNNERGDKYRLRSGNALVSKVKLVKEVGCEVAWFDRLRETMIPGIKTATTQCTNPGINMQKIRRGEKKGYLF
eukprot:TRINITY_DN37_c1_g2_i6.p1 TRINITY_DN37_c1_g2~~TRINITY_DN37_c1_g2_i6.p1  ORF type:complete len:106 (-),score=3.57 TRINITY_DN37_c1_g2_i6:123-440(-)